MTCFIDTSAILALLNRDDQFHLPAKKTWTENLSGHAHPLTSNYVVLETVAILQHRFGIEATRAFHENFYPLLEVELVNASIHQSAMDALLIAGRKNLSLVDCVSFTLMRLLGIQDVFTLDRHFREQGFRCLPESK